MSLTKEEEFIAVKRSRNVIYRIVQLCKIQLYIQNKRSMNGFLKKILTALIMKIIPPEMRQVYIENRNRFYILISREGDRCVVEFQKPLSFTCLHTRDITRKYRLRLNVDI